MRLILLFTLLIISSCSNKISSNSFLLSETYAKEMLVQCSREAPMYEGAWTPSRDDLRLLEESLKSTAELPAFAEYQFQYVGIIYKKEKAIYINALARDIKISDLGSKPAKWCDGGKAFWGAVYKVKTNTIVEVKYNGEI